MPIPFLYSSILIGIFCTSLTFQDRTPSPLPSHAPFFSCRLEASARGRWHRAGLLPPSSGVPLSIHTTKTSTPDCIPHRPIPPSSSVPLYLQQKSPGAQQIQHCQTPEQKEQMSSGYSQSTSLLAHNRITAPQLIAFRSPAKDLIDPVKPQSLPIHCIRLTSRNISFIIQRTIITSQMPLHNIRIPHN